MRFTWKRSWTITSSAPYFVKTCFQKSMRCSRPSEGKTVCARTGTASQHVAKMRSNRWRPGPSMKERLTGSTKIGDQECIARLTGERDPFSVGRAIARFHPGAAHAARVVEREFAVAPFSHLPAKSGHGL